MERRVAIIIVELEEETKSANNDELAHYIIEEIENVHKIPWLKRVEKVTVLDYSDYPE